MKSPKHLLESSYVTGPADVLYITQFFLHLYAEDILANQLYGFQSCTNYIIIIFVIWHYNPLWGFAFSAGSLQVLLPLPVSFQFFFIFSFLKSSITSSCHRCLGLPTGLVPIGFQSNCFLVGLAWSILCIWHSHLILCALLNLTISAHSINLSISMSFRILHILSILTGPNIFLSICLPKLQTA